MRKFLLAALLPPDHAQLWKSKGLDRNPPHP
jgi:hypothetical protein